MNKILIAVMLAIASTTTQAVWTTIRHDSGDVSAYGTSIIMGSSSTIGVTFDNDDNCQPYLQRVVFDDPDKSLEIPPYELTDLSAHLRVDTNGQWTSEETYVAATDNVIVHLIGPLNAVAMEELMTGSIARLKVDTDDPVYDRYSLHGSARAISKARTMCKPVKDSEYFTKPQPTEDAKYFRGA